MTVQAEETLALKKPYLVYILAACFMLAPFGNLIIALYSSGVPLWYSPAIWWKLFLSQSWPDTIILCSIFLSGVALTIQKKTSWFIAVTVLAVVVVNNMFFMEGSPEQALSPWYIPLLINSPIFVVLYFFRYPYLDKRDHILKGTHKRYQVKIPVKFSERSLEGSIISLSRGGCFVSGPTSLGKEMTVGETITLQWDDLSVPTLIAYANNKGLGLQFTKPSRDLKIKIKEKIKLSSN